VTAPSSTGAELLRLGRHDAPAVVLVPELAVTARDLRRLTAAWVGAGRRVLVLDLYGGPRPPFDYAPVIGERIPAALDEAGDGALLAGIGFGGLLALLAVADRDDAPTVVTIASGLPAPAGASSASSGLGALGGAALGGLGELGRIFGARERRIASDASGDEDRLALVRTGVLAVALGGDRTVPSDAVDRLAAALPGTVDRLDVPVAGRGDTHLRWFRRAGAPVVAAVESRLRD